MENLNKEMETIKKRKEPGNEKIAQHNLLNEVCTGWPHYQIGNRKRITKL